MEKKIFFLLSVAAVALSVSGCYYQRGYRAGRASGQYQYGWHDGYESARGRGLEEKIVDLEMHNAALKAANTHLTEQVNGR